MRFDPGYTAAYYDAYGEREAARWEKDARSRFEHAVYRRHLTDRIRKGQRVLDAGCGSGTFSKVLVDLGARVTCLDISEVQLDACRAYATGAEAYVLGSVTELGRFPDDAFDVSLAFGGPLSYCLDRADVAVRELCRVTRPGGLMGLSVMSLYGSLHRFLRGALSLPVEVNREVVRTGDLSRSINEGHECHMFRVKELEALLRDGGLEEIELHASGWLVPNGDLELPEPESEAWQLLLESELRASAEMPGAGTHIIAWGRAPR